MKTKDMNFRKQIFVGVWAAALLGMVLLVMKAEAEPKPVKIKLQGIIALGKTADTNDGVTTVTLGGSGASASGGADYPGYEDVTTEKVAVKLVPFVTYHLFLTNSSG